MEIIIKDFTYEGEHYEEFACSIPQVKEINALFKERIIAYVIGSLEEVLDWNSTFGIKDVK